MNIEEKLAACERAYIQVDLDAIESNMQNMKKHMNPNTKMLGVIKADGYGHGAVPIAHRLEPLDFIAGFAVATPEEAHILREAGVQKPIIILGYSFPYSYEILVSEDVRMAIFRRDTIEQLAQTAKKVGRKAKVHIKVDTGMGRIGISPDEEGLSFVRELVACKEIEVEGIFTHFARADEKDKTYAVEQFTQFSQFVNRIESELHITIPVKHCANSAAIMELPQTYMDVVRAGITLYGLEPSDEVDKKLVTLKPAMSLFSKIVYIKTLHKGQYLSYGGTYVAKQDVRVATIPVGYGDGYPRSLSNKGYVLIHGKKAPIIGRICMDQMMVDISGIPNVMEGDVVTLLGVDQTEQITAEQIGELSGRFNYEFICDLSKRIPRVYIQNGRVSSVKVFFNDFE